ncbi:hypothetical protein BGZ65_001077, partial [Modicella reniformis]
MVVLNPGITNNQSLPRNTRKRTRNPIRLERRIDIVQYAEDNPKMTPKQLARHFEVQLPT